MTPVEFTQWLQGHQAAFTSIRIGADTQDHWYRKLATYTLQEAQAATKEMFDNDEHTFPDRHPAKIAELIKAKKRFSLPNTPTVEDGRTFRCYLCQDKGTVSVYHPKWYKPIGHGTHPEKSAITDIAVACNCPAGKRYYEPQPDRDRGHTMKPMKRFHKKTMCRVLESGIAEQKQELLEFLQSDYESRPDNYEPAFDDWSK